MYSRSMHRRKHHPPSRPTSSQYEWAEILSNVSQWWTTEALRGHLVLSKLQSAWQQDCRHSPFAAMYFCLTPPINTIPRAYFEPCRPCSVSICELQKQTKQKKLLERPSSAQTHFPYKLNLSLSHCISSGLWDNIWRIRLWNVCLSSAPTLHLPEQLLLWLHKDLGQHSYTT